jgi:outer membrane protein TolC
MKRSLSAALTGLFLLATSAAADTITLASCLKLAAGRNPALAVARHDEKIAAESITVAGSSAYPRIDVQGGYTAQLDAQAVKIGPLTQETQQADYGFANLSIYQTLYDFGRTSDRRRQASLRREAVAAGYQALEQDLFLQVVRAYYGILEQEKLLQTAEDEIRQREDHLRVARILFEQGVVTRNDVLQAEVKLAASRQQRLAAGNALANGWLTLNYLTGQPAAFRGDLSAAPDGRTPQESTTDVSCRMELVAQQKQIAAGEAAVSDSRSSYYPEVFTRLSLDYLQNDKAREQAIMAATIGLKVNLFDGYATTAGYRRNVLQLSREKELLRNLEESIRLELATARNDMGVAAQRIEVARQAIIQSEENLRINKDRYQAQVGTATDVIDAQTLASQTRTDFHRAVFDHQVATARVLRALGQL